MTTNNHPAHGHVSLDRLHQIREILSKAAAQSDGGNLCYAMADAVKVIDGAIADFGAELDEFLPDNLDRALTILGVALPISKEEFNLDAERWMQRLINRVIRLESELIPPPPVVPEIDRKAIADKVYGKCCRIPGATFYNAAEFAIDEMEACRAAMLQAGNHTEQRLDMVDHSGDASENVDCRLSFDQWLSQQNEPIDVDCGCVTTEAFYHWLRAAYDAGNSPVIGVDLASGPDRTVEVRYVAPPGYVMVPKKLTAENGAKSVLSGEFSETKFINCPECFGDDDCETCDGSGRIEITVPVTWTTIKAIWAKGVEHFAAAPQQEVK